MALEIRTNTGKLMGIVDCENEFIISNGKKVPLKDAYSNDNIRKEFNDELISSNIEIDNE